MRNTQSLIFSAGLSVLAIGVTAPVIALAGMTPKSTPTAQYAAMSEPDQKMAYDSWPAEKQARFDAWPVETQDYYWTLSPERQQMFWALTDEDRVLLTSMSGPDRESTWEIIEARASGEPPSNSEPNA